MIKPLAEGSSFGVEVIFPEDNFSFKEYSWKYGDTVIVEEYIPGKEIHVAVVGDKAIGAVELFLRDGFMIMKAKYTEGKATHHMPARLSEATTEKVLSIAQKVHDVMGCQGISRVDFRIDDTQDGEDKCYVLELNTHPGFTSLSLVPEVANYHGIAFQTLVMQLIEGAACGK